MSPSVRSMDFMDDLDAQQKECVEEILKANNSIEDKLTTLRDIQISEDICEKIKKTLVLEENKRMEKTNTFLSLVNTQDKRTLAGILLKQNRYADLNNIVAKQTQGCKKAFKDLIKEKGLVFVSYSLINYKLRHTNKTKFRMKTKKVPLQMTKQKHSAFWTLLTMKQKLTNRRKNLSGAQILHNNFLTSEEFPSRF